MIIDGETGLLSEEKDTDGLAAHLRWLTENTGQWEDDDATRAGAYQARI